MDFFLVASKITIKTMVQVDPILGAGVSDKDSRLSTK